MKFKARPIRKSKITFDKLNTVPRQCKIKQNKKYKGIRVQNSEDAASLVRKIGNEEIEHFSAIYLDPKNNVLDVATEAIGDRTSVNTNTGRVLRSAILRGADAVVVAHNHPSGNPRPSKADVKVCKVMKDIGEKIDMPVLDCLVITKKEYTSLTDEGV